MENRVAGEECCFEIKFDPKGLTNWHFTIILKIHFEKKIDQDGFFISGSKLRFYKKFDYFLMVLLNNRARLLKDKNLITITEVVS